MCGVAGCSQLGLNADQNNGRRKMFLNTQSVQPFCGKYSQPESNESDIIKKSSRTNIYIAYYFICIEQSEIRKTNNFSHQTLKSIRLRLNNVYLKSIRLRLKNVYLKSIRLRLNNVYLKSIRLRLNNVYLKSIRLRLKNVYLPRLPVRCDDRVRDTRLGRPAASDGGRQWGTRTTDPHHTVHTTDR